MMTSPNFRTTIFVIIDRSIENIDEMHRGSIRSSVKMCILSIRRRFLPKKFGDDEKKSYLCHKI